MSRKKEMWAKEAKGCPNYKPCPICFSCENKAVHLYEACMTCQVPIDHHNHVGKAWMIKRENFQVVTSEETLDAFQELAEAAHERN